MTNVHNKLDKFKCKLHKQSEFVTSVVDFWGMVDLVEENSVLIHGSDRYTAAANMLCLTVFDMFYH